MDSIQQEHRQLTRRFFAQLLTAASTAMLMPGCRNLSAPAFAETVSTLPYLTTQEMFGTVERGNPLPYKLPPAELEAAGLTPKTWALEIIPDADDPAELERALTVAEETAFTYADLEHHAKRHSVRFLKTLTCANGAKPLGTGLWEGIPLRDVVRLTGVRKNFRRMHYYGFHNHDPKQIFRSSLAADRLFEDPLQTPPVILAYRLNGEPLSGKRGGPVRLVVPEAYGFKSVKWLHRIVLSNRSTSNDTYARFNNTTESWMKTLARFGVRPKRVRAGVPIPISGIAQVGTTGLTGVEVLLTPADEGPSEMHWRDDRRWTPMTVLGPPTDDWGGRLPASDHPAGRRGRATTFGFSEDTGEPAQWPMRFTTAHWAGVLPAQRPGTYQLRCRSLDRTGTPQPWPRTLQNSGRNRLHHIPLTVTD